MYTGRQIIKDNREDLDNLFHGLMSLVDLCVASLQIPLPSHISIHGNNEANKAAKSALEFEIVKFKIPSTDLIFH